MKLRAKNVTQIVVFTLNEQKYGLMASAVQRVIRAVEITSLPKAPEIVLGVINLEGEIIPVLDIRKRFHLPPTEIDPANNFIISTASSRTVAVVVDAVLGLHKTEETSVFSEKNLPGAEYVQGIVKLQDGMILIHDLDQFLSLEEKTRLDDAIRN
jgi:Chemotaxis signal transduction protein